MTTQFNPWWFLPVVTLTMGLFAGQRYFSSELVGHDVQMSAPAATSAEPKIPTFEVVTVALPPTPVYQPQLEAKVVNNKVVVSKEQVKPAVETNDNEAIDPNSVLAQRFNQVLNDMESEQQQPTETLHSQPLTR